MTNEQTQNTSPDHRSILLKESYMKWRQKSEIKKARDESSTTQNKITCSAKEKNTKNKINIMESIVVQRILAEESIKKFMEDKYIKHIINRKDPNLQYLIPNNSFESYFVFSNKILLLLEDVFLDR